MEESKNKREEEEKKEKKEKEQKVIEIISESKKNDYIVDETYNIYGENINCIENILKFIKEKKNESLYFYVKKINKLMEKNYPRISFKKSNKKNVGIIKTTKTYTSDNRNTKYFNIQISQSIEINENNVEDHIELNYKKFKRKFLDKELFTKTFLLNYNYNDINEKRIFKNVKRCSFT